MAADSGNGADDRRRDLADPFASGRKPRQPRPTVPPPSDAPPAAEPPAPPKPPTAARDEVVEETTPPGEPPVDGTRASESTSEENEEMVEAVPGDVHDVEQEADPFITDEDLELLKGAEHDLVAEYRERAARAEAELENFRRRVERDRQANREAVIAEVLRSMLPAMDDLDRAESHGDLDDGSPLAIVAQKLRTAIERHGLVKIGEVGEAFNPHLHEALMQKPSSDVSTETVAAVIEVGYQLGDRLIRPAKVAVNVPE